jgi:hypothetical protein
VTALAGHEADGSVSQSPEQGLTNLAFVFCGRGELGHRDDLLDGH